MNYLRWFLCSYGFDSPREFWLSVFPSFKYNTQGIAFSLSVAVAVVSEFLGLSPLIVAAMFAGVVVETITGIRASGILKQPFESFRFSRCVIKVFIWCFLFFLLHCFSKEMTGREGWMFSVGRMMFDVMYVTTMIYFCVEYVTSILENLAVIDGKPKDTLINAMKDAFEVMFDNLKRLFK
ncbi:MAG: phage holin family protein [Bacteroidaceae bacterium]